VRSDTEPAPADADAATAGEATAAAADPAADEAHAATERHVIELARSQITSGLSLLAEGTVRRRIARLEAGGGPSVSDEIDAARLLLAEALWRQGRPIAARSTLDAIRASSPQRRLPIAMIIEAEALAAAGELDRSAGLVERVVRDIGADAAWELRAGTGGRAAWPQPAVLEHRPEVPAHAPWESAPGENEPPDVERAALARGRVEAARVAYTRDEAVDGDLGDHGEHGRGHAAPGPGDRGRRPQRAGDEPDRLPGGEQLEGPRPGRPPQPDRGQRGRDRGQAQHHQRPHSQRRVREVHVGEREQTARAQVVAPQRRRHRLLPGSPRPGWSGLLT
jgi:hypothetical protein